MNIFILFCSTYTFRKSITKKFDAYFVITFSEALAPPSAKLWLHLQRSFGSTFSEALAPPFLKVDKGG